MSIPENQTVEIPDEKLFLEEDNGNLFWFKDTYRTVYHRDGDKPAMEYRDGSKYWWQNNSLHRVRGPAYIGPRGGKSYWFNDSKLTPYIWAKKTGHMVCVKCQKFCLQFCSFKSR